jgi:hypothetical protein
MNKIEQKRKILTGLEKSYERLLISKRQKQSVLVVIKDNKIVKIKP